MTPIYNLPISHFVLQHCKFLRHEEKQELLATQLSKNFSPLCQLNVPLEGISVFPHTSKLLPNICTTILFIYTVQRALTLCPKPKTWNPAESAVTVKFRTLCQSGVSLKLRPPYPKINMIQNYVFSGIFVFHKTSRIMLVVTGIVYEPLVQAVIEVDP